jgi:hypothetical protein
MSLTSTTLTQLWTLTKGSSVIRRTTFDQPLIYGGHTYAVAPLQPSRFDEQIDLNAKPDRDRDQPRGLRRHRGSADGQDLGPCAVADPSG